MGRVWDQTKQGLNVSEGIENWWFAVFLPESFEGHPDFSKQIWISTFPNMSPYALQGCQISAPRSVFGG